MSSSQFSPSFSSHFHFSPLRHTKTMDLLLQGLLLSLLLFLLPPLVPAQVQQCSTKDFKQDPKGFIKCVRKSSAAHYHSNSITDFCVPLQTLKPGNKSNSAAKPPKYDFEPPPNVTDFRYYGPQAGKGYNGTLLSHFDILRELGRHDAWSNQRTDDLPFSSGEPTNPREYENTHWDMNYPEAEAPNPYYVEVSRIKVKGDILHGFLHFRIFMNRSEALGKGQTSREGSLHKKDEKPDNARGFISAALIMVKDQEGWPIGDFSVDIPCRRSCNEYPTETYYGDKTNALPCAFTPPRATSHPGMFVFDTHPGFYLPDSLTRKRPGVFRETTVDPLNPSGVIDDICECDNQAANAKVNCTYPAGVSNDCTKATCPTTGNTCSKKPTSASGRKKRMIPEEYQKVFWENSERHGERVRRQSPNATNTSGPASGGGGGLGKGPNGGPQNTPWGQGINEEDGVKTYRNESFNIPQHSRHPGVREVHATWNFNQDSCQFASKLFIQTLILEEVRFPFTPDGADTPEEQRPRVYGWSAQYNVLLPTKKSLGAADYVDLEYLRDRDSKAHEIDCHVPMFDAPKTYGEGFNKGPKPKKGVGEQSVPSQSSFLRSLTVLAEERANGSKSIDDVPEYFGQFREPDQLCRIQVAGGDSSINPENPANKKEPSPPKVSKFFQDKKSKALRCPCPALATPLPVENRTTDPARLHGRLIHASHMTIAYMLLTPLACFVARYYKETFVTVFCFQEYWWFMWHVCFLMIACVFNVGAVVSIILKKGEPIPESTNLLIHKIFGAISIFVFYMEIFTGFCRHADPNKRMRQIFMHWLIGLLNNFCAIFSMFAMAWVPSSGMSCRVVYTIISWLIFVIFCYIIMEIAMRRGDKKLNLKPKRTYLPPPVVRLFARDAPGKDFRMIMLLIFILGLLAFQLVISYYIWNSEGECCYEEYIKLKEEAKKYKSPDDKGNQKTQQDVDYSDEY